MMSKIILLISITISFLKTGQFFEICMYDEYESFCLPTEQCKGRFKISNMCKQANTVCCEIESSKKNVPEIVGGIEADINEFPHMALLGYGNTTDKKMSWECGGSLINDQWVLTAAHCTWSRNMQSAITLVMLGSNDINSTDSQLLYGVKKIISHPQYVGNKVYNDIALLKLEKKVIYKEGVTPACIHDLSNTDVSDLNITQATAAGWGTTSFRGERSNQLLKVTLERFDFDECKSKIGKSRRQPEGLVNATQICYGSRKEEKDTCQGDSGGPLHVFKWVRNCAYTIIGLTSFGFRCGEIGMPGVYTRVSAYADWIKNTIAAENI